MRVLLALALIGCSTSYPRDNQVSEETRALIQARARDTARWVPWCEDYPSKDDCSDGDAMAHGIGYLAAMGFEPSMRAVGESVRDGQLMRSPLRQDTTNTASRDQLLGFMAGQLLGEHNWLDVKRFIEKHEKICLDATDTRCNLTPVIKGLIAETHAHLGYPRDTQLYFWEKWFPYALAAQSAGVPTGYQLNLIVNASWLTWAMGNETRSSYMAAKNAYLRQPLNPWFCIVYKGPNQECADKALALWPTTEPTNKTQWSIERDTSELAYLDSMGWEFLFMAAHFGVDLNELEYLGKRFPKGNHQSH